MVKWADIIRRHASANGLDPALVASIIEQESGGNTWAMRYEPNWKYMFGNPVKARGGCSLDTEVMQQKTSFGLMQVMGAVARERGLTDPFLSCLCDPEVGVRVGCEHLARMRSRWPDRKDYVSAYNSGKPGPKNYDSYVAPILARVAEYEAEL